VQGGPTDSATIVDVLATLLERDADLEAKDGHTALLLAVASESCKYNNNLIVNYLLNRGANTHADDEDSYS
jgi:ankyrin repeat protein